MMNALLATRRVLPWNKVKAPRATAYRRHASFYNADIAGLTDEQIEV